jgi:subtilisin family serine protease
MGSQAKPVQGLDDISPLAWGLRRLDIAACWQRGLTGAGVRVGHLDSGVDGSHPALRGRVVAFMEIDREGIPIQAGEPKDSASHGTHTAGVICGGQVDHQTIGAAPGAVLCSGMVIEGGQTLVRVLAGLEWICDCAVRVLCLSVGLPVYNPLFEIALRRLKSAGVLVIAPVGNRGAGCACSPASYPGVIAVGALRPDDRVAHFSGSQQFKRAVDNLKPNLVAPGVDILSAVPGGGLQTRSGTSMAAAHVAGAAALLFQANPRATPDEVREALLATCEPLPGASESRSGRGLLYPARAIELIVSNQRSYAGWRPSLTSG